MSLRTKTLAAIAVTLLILMAVLYGLAREIVTGGFEKVEKSSLAGFAAIEDSDTRRNVSRVSDALTFRIDTLAVKAADWAQWDDTYQFIGDRNKAYIESNLGEGALAPLKINFIIFADAGGRMVYGSGYDLENEADTPVPESLKKYLTPGSKLLTHESPESFTAGILPLPEGPLMIATRPIVRSSGEGPIRGTVLFGRYLDDAEFMQLAEITHLTIVHLYSLNKDIPPDFAGVLGAITPENPILVKTRDDNIISGYTAVKDLEGNPLLYLRVDISRDIYRQGIATRDDIRERGQIILTSLIIAILVTATVLCLVIGVVIERWVLARLLRLSRNAVDIGEHSDFHARVEDRGQDEISSLGSSVNKMLEALEGSHHEIEERNAEMRLVMDTIPTGLLSVDENLRINPEYSRSVVRMLGGEELRGRDYLEVLGLSGERAEDGRTLAEFLDVMRQELVDEDTISGLNPFEELPMGHGHETRWLRIRYFLIRRGEGLANHTLAVFEDITEKKRLAAPVARSNRENLQLKAIAEDPDLFREFLSESGAILKNVETKAALLDTTEKSRPLVNEIFRGVHTIKGVSGSFGLVQLSEAAGELESSLEPLRAEGVELTGEHIEDTLEKLKDLAACYVEARDSAKKILGDEGEEGGGMFLRVSSEELRRHIEEIKGMAVEESMKDAIISKMKREILRRLTRMREVPARRGLARSLKIVPGLIERLGKDAEFRLVGEDTPIDCDIARELNTPLIHMIRNALDHGVEDLEARIEAGKSEQGLVSLTVERSDEGLRLTLADDGKGLDAEKLKEIALRKGVITPEEAKALVNGQAFELIFRPGFSTAEEVTDVSGRGVGMEAVRSSIYDTLGGTIRIESEKGRGTRFIIEVPAGV